MNVDGSGSSFHVEGGQFSWSPDGSLVHDWEAKPGDVDVYLDGESLFDGPGIETLPAWSPDSTSIVFSSDRP